MSKRAKITTTISQIVQYWSKNIDESELSIDWFDAGTHCWRCGRKRKLERCHIIPNSLGGEDSPRNLVLLCKQCHEAGPNVADPEIMWDWLKAYKVPMYGSFEAIMAQREYKFIYGKNFEQELEDIFSRANLTLSDEIYSEINSQIAKVIRETENHFGQPYLNISTIAGVYRMVLKETAKRYAVKFPIEM